MSRRQVSTNSLYAFMGGVRRLKAIRKPTPSRELVHCRTNLVCLNPDICGFVPKPIDPDFISARQTKLGFKSFKPDYGPPDTHDGAIRHDFTACDSDFGVEYGKDQEHQNIDASDDRGG
ncbi:hypothetical protein ANO14919_050840 [Xylariales sp. No.14919]|nr:hypothetical protein ANO14919_050840 [Xylariales sp. No.14919]